MKTDRRSTLQNLIPFRLLSILLITVSVYSSHVFAQESLIDKAKELGEKAKEMGKDAWEATSDFSQEAWKNTKDWSSKAWEKSAEWVEQGEAALNDMLEPEDPVQARRALNTMSDVSLAKLFRTTPKAKALFDKAYGYAVFDSRSFSLVLHANGGSGVAVNLKTGERTYMNMLGGGLALGIGGKFYQQIMLFLTEQDFKNFTADGWDKGWKGGSEAGVVVWDEAAEVNFDFHDGLAVFVMNEKGILLDANLSGSKYWRDKDLNLQKDST